MSSGLDHRTLAVAGIRYGPTRCVIVTLVLSAGLLLNQGCSSGHLEVEFVFPDGFRGPAVIRENQSDGTPVCEVPWLPRTKVCVFGFPASGVLHTQGVSPTKNWHRASARYENGTAIPVSNKPGGVIVAKDEVAVWYGPALEGEDWLFVGTEDEFRKFKYEKERYKY